MGSNWTHVVSRITITVLCGAIWAIMGVAVSPGDASRGRDAFEKRCTGCHALDKVKIGPRMRGLYGRQSGKDRDFTYSDAFKNTRVTWNESTLDRWLTDTDSVIPGNDMLFRINDADERANIIAYLKQLSEK